MESTTRDDLRAWFDTGVELKADFMIVVRDTFDAEDFAVYVHRNKSVREVAQRLEDAPMSRVLEIYDLRADKEAQIKTAPTWAIPKPVPGVETQMIEAVLSLLKTHGAS